MCNAHFVSPQCDTLGHREWLTVTGDRHPGLAACWSVLVGATWCTVHWWCGGACLFMRVLQALSSFVTHARGASLRRRRRQHVRRGGTD
eukprot:scaffold17460_cov128-Isochrysis_galbana.AAC.14